MSIDDLGRAAATDVRRKATQEIDPTKMLKQLRRKQRNRSVATAVAVVGVVAAGTILVANGALPGHHQSGNTASRPSPSPTISGPCHNALVTCLGGNKYLVALTVPVTVTLPANFQGAFAQSGNASGVFEDYRTDNANAGITVMENATPVKYDASWSQDPTAGNTAASIATWLSKRPFLSHTSLTRTNVGGRAAWRVSSDLKPGAALPAEKNGTGPVAPTFTDTPYNTAGYRPGLTGQYTLLDVPGAGVTVIWSWSNSSQGLISNQAYIDGLSFG